MAYRDPNPSPKRYHSIDVRPDNDSDGGVMSPPTAYPPAPLPDPYGSQTNLASTSAYPSDQQRHPHFGHSTSSLTPRYLSPNGPGMRTPADEGGNRREYQKMDEKPPLNPRHSSYDIFAAAENFDTRNASEKHLTFAEGDFVVSVAMGGRV